VRSGISRLCVLGSGYPDCGAGSICLSEPGKPIGSATYVAGFHWRYLRKSVGRTDLDLTAVQDARAINVYGNGMLPLYRHGDQLIVSAKVPVKAGDRILLELKDGSHVCGTLSRKTHQLVGINIGGQSRKEALIDTSRIAFLGRVIWASK